jgi:hypothetical protein
MECGQDVGDLVKDVSMRCTSRIRLQRKWCYHVEDATDPFRRLFVSPGLPAFTRGVARLIGWVLAVEASGSISLRFWVARIRPFEQGW